MSNMNGFPMNFGGMGGMGSASGNDGAGQMGGIDFGPEEMNMNSMMFNAAAAGMGNQMGGILGGGHPFQMGGGGVQGDMRGMNMDAMAMNAMGGGNAAGMNMNMNMNLNNQFVPELDMMALYRAKQNMNMMHRGRAGGSVQDKMLAFTQEQYTKGQGLPISARAAGLDGLPFTSFLADGGATGVSSGMKRSSAEVEFDVPSKKKKGQDKEGKVGKKRKKNKKSTDMPRRALSAYNIFFSEQREVILKEIDDKEMDGTSKKLDSDEEKDVKKEDVKKEVEDKDDKQVESEDKDDHNAEEDDEKMPTVLNRTFFPKRAKRAHRKVHGKIGLVDLAREVSKRWKELSSEKRKVYEDLAAEDRKRHKEIMAEYQERKAAENMVSLGVNDSADEEEAIAGLDDGKQNKAAQSDQDVQDSMAHQYQQRILAEMMAARRPQQDQMSMMNNNFAMSNRLGGNAGGMGMSDMQAMHNMNNMQDMNAMLELQNQQRALMLQRMRMGGMGGMGGMGMDGMGGMGPSM